MALLVCAALTFKEAPLVGLNQPTPLLGVWERANVALFLLWTIVVAIVLFVRAHAGPTPPAPVTAGPARALVS